MTSSSRSWTSTDCRSKKGAIMGALFYACRRWSYRINERPKAAAVCDMRRELILTFLCWEGEGYYDPPPGGALSVIRYPSGFSGGLLASLNGCGLAHKGVALQARQRWVCIHRAASWPWKDRVQGQRPTAPGRVGLGKAHRPTGPVPRRAPGGRIF